eukprot:14042370-Alexandrium_andersonii.AAC.1
MRVDWLGRLLGNRHLTNASSYSSAPTHATVSATFERFQLDGVPMRPGARACHLAHPYPPAGAGA